jgi:hypothetical protein
MCRVNLNDAFMKFRAHEGSTVMEYVFNTWVG